MISSNQLKRVVSKKGTKELQDFYYVKNHKRIFPKKIIFDKDSLNAFFNQIRKQEREEIYQEIEELFKKWTREYRKLYPKKNSYDAYERFEEISTFITELKYKGGRNSSHD